MARWRTGLAATVAGLAVGAAFAQPPKAETNKATATITKASAETTPEPAKPAESLAGMLADARAAYGKLRDYTGTYTRQERINGVLSAEQVGEMKMRVNPVGVYVRFARPEAYAGAEVVFSGAKKDGKVRYRPAGLPGRKGFLKLDPEDAKFLTDHRHPVTEWGMGPILDLIASATAREKTLNNPVEVHASDYQFANRNVVRYEIVTRRAHAFRYAARMVVYVDKETKLPVRFEAYGDPKAGTTTPELLEAYSFTDLKFNNGLGENIFDY